MPDSLTEFFMVWSESGCSPTVKHPSLDIAKAEAERLTRKQGGQYHVLKSVGTTKRNDVIWIDHEIDDVPF